MADKEININIRTNVDTSNVEDLSELIEAIQSKAGEGIDITIDSSSIDEASTSADNLAESADNASSSLDETSSSADDVANSAGGIDSSQVDALGDSAGNASENFSNLANEVQNTNDAVSMVDAMAGAELSNSITSGYYSMADAAGNYNDSMVRLGYALDGTSMSVEQAEAKYGSMISTMTDATGRGAGDVRQHLTKMGNAGITNSQVLQDSFNGVSKAAFQMQQPIEAMDASFQKMVLSGNAGKRQLLQMGLTIDDVAAAMGVSADEASKAFQNLDENSRAAVLSSALNMKYGEDVTENYKNSYEHLTASLDRAKEGLIRVVGEALLPTLIPALETATTLIGTVSTAFSGLPEPIKTVLGGALTLTVGLTTLGLGFASVTKMIGFAVGPYMKLYNWFTKPIGTAQLTGYQQALQRIRTVSGNVKNSLKSLGTGIKNLGTRFMEAGTRALSFARNLASTVISAVRNAVTAFANLARSVLTAGLNALRSAGMWALQKAQLIATTIAEKAAAAAQWLLNVAMSMNPIMLVVIAIGLLIAALAYLYFNNEQVRTAIDGLGQTLMNIGTIIYGYLLTAWNTVISTLQMVWNFIVTLGSQLWTFIITTLNNILTGIMSFIVWYMTIPARIGAALTNIISRVINFGSQLVSRFVSAGSRAVSNFISYISQIPGKLSSELSSTFNRVSEWAATLPQKFWDAGVNAVKNFLDALGIHSPGIIQTKLLTEMENTGARIPSSSQGIIRNVSKVGNDILDAFGDPKLIVGVDDSIANASLLGEINTGSSGYGDQVININLEIGSVDNEKRIQEIVDAVRRNLAWNNKTAGRTV